MEIEPWEPEETVGKFWHQFAHRLGAREQYGTAAVHLSEIDHRLAVFFRGMGGSSTVQMRSSALEASHHRLGFLHRLGTDVETLPCASYDGEVMRLPEQLAIFAERGQNEMLYLWLVACIAHAPSYHHEDDSLRKDLRAIQAARMMRTRVLKSAPGLKRVDQMLCELCLQQRVASTVTKLERAVEAVIHHDLGDGTALSDWAQMLNDAIETDDFSSIHAPARYRTFLPVPLWPHIRALSKSATRLTEEEHTGGGTLAGGESTHRARRQETDQVERPDSFILHKFEAILSWTEMLNINRRVEDDDPDSAKKAAEDANEMGLGQVTKAPATKLKLHLDLAPEDVERERLSVELAFPEWDARAGQYLVDHVQVLLSMAEASEETPAFRKDPRAYRRIRHVRRQFEALRPARVPLSAQPDGDEWDMDAAVRAKVDFSINGTWDEMIWRQTRTVARDLAVSLLLDISRSTESAVTGRAIIDIEKEALCAFAWGLEGCGDAFAIHAFSSLKRDRVFVQQCKDFDEPMSELIEKRIAGLQPRFYTRLGAAIRFTSSILAKNSKKKRLLLVITDGKPNDLDHYEGRHGIEDTAMAIREARRMGHKVFGITVDRQSQSWFPRLFGRGAFHVTPHPDKLTEALSKIYHNLVKA